METQSSHCRANPECTDANTAHRIAVEVYDLPGNHGGGSHVKDQIGCCPLARLQQNRRRAPTGGRLNKPGMFNRDHVSSRFNIVDLEPTFYIGSGGVLATGLPVLCAELQIRLSNRLPSGLL